MRRHRRNAESAIKIGALVAIHSAVVCTSIGFNVVHQYTARCLFGSFYNHAACLLEHL